MADINQELIDKRFDELPPPLQDALFDPDVLSHLVSAASRYHLLEENQDALLFVFGQVVMGFISLSDFNYSIASETGLAAPLAKTLADEIRHDVLDHLNLTKLISPAIKTATPPPVPTANILNLKRAPAASIPISPLSSIPPPFFSTTTPRPATVSNTPPPPTGGSGFVGATPIAPRPLPKPLEQIGLPTPPAVPGTPTYSVGALTPPAIPAAPGPVAPLRRDFLRPAEALREGGLRPAAPNAAPSSLPTGGTGAAPFVLHRESEVKPIARPPLTSSSAVSRITHSDTPSPTQPSSATARVEIGRTVRSKRRDELSRPTRFSPDSSHSIDYSALSAATPRDPFSGIKSPLSSSLTSNTPNPLSPPPPKLSVPPPPSAPQSPPLPSSPPPSPSGPRLSGHTVDLRQKN